MDFADERGFFFLMKHGSETLGVIICTKKKSKEKGNLSLRASIAPTSPLHIRPRPSSYSFNKKKIPKKYSKNQIKPPPPLFWLKRSLLLLICFFLKVNHHNNYTTMRKLYSFNQFFVFCYFQHLKNTRVLPAEHGSPLMQLITPRREGLQQLICDTPIAIVHDHRFKLSTPFSNGSDTLVRDQRASSDVQFSQVRTGLCQGDQTLVREIKTRAEIEDL